MPNTTPCRFSEGPLLRTSYALEVPNLAAEDVLHVSGARVAVAEYDVLQHDFPELRTEHVALLNPWILDLPEDEQARAVRGIIDHWLVAHAYISTSQAAQTVVNTPVLTDDRHSIAYRPPRYGRALVVPTTGGQDGSGAQPVRLPVSQGLLDLKGTGVSPTKVPSDRVQSNGLEYLDLALTDFLVKKVIDEVLARELPDVWTVPVYAVLDLGFDILVGFHGVGHAGMHVRRAHRRRLERKMGPAERIVTFEIESALRRYGITAATRDLRLHIRREGDVITWQLGSDQTTVLTDPIRLGTSLALLRDRDALTLDRCDVQMAREVEWPPASAQMVDFGAIRIEDGFDCPMLRDNEGSVLEEIIWPTDWRFVNPDPALQLPVEIWNRYKLKACCSEWACAFRQGGLSADELRLRIDKLLLALTSTWPP